MLIDDLTDGSGGPAVWLTGRRWLLVPASYNSNVPPPKRGTPSECAFSEISCHLSGALSEQYCSPRDGRRTNAEAPLVCAVEGLHRGCSPGDAARGRQPSNTPAMNRVERAQLSVSTPEEIDSIAGVDTVFWMKIMPVQSLSALQMPSCFNPAAEHSAGNCEPPARSCSRCGPAFRNRFMKKLTRERRGPQ